MTQVPLEDQLTIAGFTHRDLTARRYRFPNERRTSSGDAVIAALMPNPIRVAELDQLPHGRAFVSGFRIVRCRNVVPGPVAEVGHALIVRNGIVADPPMYVRAMHLSSKCGP